MNNVDMQLTQPLGVAGKEGSEVGASGRVLRLFQPVRLPALPSAGLLALRVVAGSAFMLHGWGKIQNPFAWAGPDSFPAALQFLAALSEFGGGLAWILGLLTPLASFGIASTMAVATHLHAVKLGDPFVSMTGGRSYELPALFLVLALALMLVGPGRFSLDRIVFKERQ